MQQRVKSQAEGWICAIHPARQTDGRQSNIEAVRRTYIYSPLGTHTAQRIKEERDEKLKTEMDARTVRQTDRQTGK